ncbi:protein charybde-like isoform X2 [Cimex lectularius]|uniref:Protein charybde n=1 Tax=Cimex lectularius TaxID=79782 RepID=A0A8I6R5P3_CIMLE|nr:protein charybde-like isoform X2 [Cimex lectularius]
MEVLPCPVSVNFLTPFPRGVRDDMLSWNCELALARRLETELRAAKSEQLSCGEVLLPSDLLQRVSSEVLSLAEVEPCGLRGCTLYVEFLPADFQQARRIATVKCDPNTVSTFELTLTLRQDRSSGSWTNILPQFIKNLTRGGTIMISHDFDITKKKLYRSYLE